MSKPLSGRVAVVVGATRGAGRGIARMLGEAGATVYCTGRTSRARPNVSSRVSAGRRDDRGNHRVLHRAEQAPGR